MNKGELIVALAEKSSVTKKDTAAVLDAFVEVVAETVSKGDEVSLSGLGVFKRVDRAARKARNPKTGESIDVPAKKTVKFKVSSLLKKKVAEV